VTKIDQWPGCDENWSVTWVWRKLISDLGVMKID
jgi:hypothetical protein